MSGRGDANTMQAVTTLPGWQEMTESFRRVRHSNSPWLQRKVSQTCSLSLSRSQTHTLGSGCAFVQCVLMPSEIGGVRYHRCTSRGSNVISGAVEDPADLLSTPQADWV